MNTRVLLGYSVSCFLLHHVLQHHYWWACRSTIFSIFLTNGSTYCTLIDNSLKALQWSPVVFAIPLFLNNPNIPQHA